MFGLPRLARAIVQEHTLDSAAGYALDGGTPVLNQFLIGISGALVGVIGWLLVGLYIQKRAHDRQARDAARAVYFELAANRLVIFIASEYGSYGPLSRSAYDRLLPELSTWLPAAELQALVMAYLGHGGYEQASADDALPERLKRTALQGLLEAQNTALALLHQRVFSEKEAASLNHYVQPDYIHMMDAAERSSEGSR
jgi:hypothetical protein